MIAELNPEWPIEDRTPGARAGTSTRTVGDGSERSDASSRLRRLLTARATMHKFMRLDLAVVQHTWSCRFQSPTCARASVDFPSRWPSTVMVGGIVLEAKLSDLKRVLAIVRAWPPRPLSTCQARRPAQGGESGRGAREPVLFPDPSRVVRWRRQIGDIFVRDIVVQRFFFPVSPNLLAEPVSTRRRARAQTNTLFISQSQWTSHCIARVFGVLPLSTPRPALSGQGSTATAWVMDVTKNCVEDRRHHSSPSLASHPILLPKFENVLKTIEREEQVLRDLQIDRNTARRVVS